MITLATCEDCKGTPAKAMVTITFADLSIGGLSSTKLCYKCLLRWHLMNGLRVYELARKEAK